VTGKSSPVAVFEGNPDVIVEDGDLPHAHQPVCLLHRRFFRPLNMSMSSTSCVLEPHVLQRAQCSRHAGSEAYTGVDFRFRRVRPCRSVEGALFV
jgi:hypothetical protein